MKHSHNFNIVFNIMLVFIIVTAIMTFGFMIWGMFFIEEYAPELVEAITENLKKWLSYFSSTLQ